MAFRKEIEFLPEVHFPKKYPDLEDWDKVITETAGFIPLEVRFKQMEQAGIRAQFFENEFSSKDVTDMYLGHPEFDLTTEDDLEDAMEKISLRAAYIEDIKARRAQSNGVNDMSGTEETKEKEKAPKKEDKEES